MAMSHQVAMSHQNSQIDDKMSSPAIRYGKSPDFEKYWIGTHKISMNEFPAIRSNSCPRNSPIRVKHHWSDDVISTGSLWAHHHSNSRHIWQKIRKVLWRLFGKIIIAAKTAENSAFLNFLLIHYRPESLWNSLWKFSLKLRGVFVFPDDTNDKSSGLIEIS